MNLIEAISHCCSDKIEIMGTTYDSIVWKHITETEYNDLSSDEKIKYVLNDSSYSDTGPKYTIKQIIHTDGTIGYHNLLSTDEYEELDNELKSNYKIAHKMYSLVPIPLEDIESMYSEYITKTKPLTDLRRKRDILLSQTDKYAIPDWPHKTPEIRQMWLDYRQALRDLPNNENTVWPTPPK